MWTWLWAADYSVRYASSDLLAYFVSMRAPWPRFLLWCVWLSFYGLIANVWEMVIGINRGRELVIAGAVILLGTIASKQLNDCLKVLAGRPEPDGEVFRAWWQWGVSKGRSWPSGHVTTGAVVLCWPLLVRGWRRPTRRAQAVAWLASGAVVAVTAGLRLSAHEHYLSDVCAAALISWGVYALIHAAIPIDEPTNWQ